VSAATVQSKILEILLADTPLSAEFGTQMLKGMGRNFDFQQDSKGLHVYLMLENFNYNTLPRSKLLATYPFLITVMFYETDDVKIEERKTAYSQLVRKALETNTTLDGTAIDANVGDPRYSFHPVAEGQNYIAIPFTVRVREAVGS